MLVDYDKATHPVRESLSEEVHVHQVKVVTTFLKAGVPLSKLDTFRARVAGGKCVQVLRQHQLVFTYTICAPARASQYLEGDSGKSVSVIFDSTTHVREALAIIQQFVDDQYQIQQRAVCVCC